MPDRPATVGAEFREIPSASRHPRPRRRIQGFSIRVPSGVVEPGHDDRKAYQGGGESDCGEHGNQHGPQQHGQPVAQHRVNADFAARRSSFRRGGQNGCRPSHRSRSAACRRGGAGRSLGLTVLKSPPHSPKANAICERVIGTIRRECLDWLIPLSESHLRSILRSWVGHYNHGRPHMALGPGVPDPPSEVVPFATQPTRRRIGERLGVRAGSVPGGLHHEYRLAPGLA
jgi:hypothetical protein